MLKSVKLCVNRYFKLLAAFMLLSVILLNVTYAGAVEKELTTTPINIGQLVNDSIYIDEEIDYTFTLGASGRLSYSLTADDTVQFNIYIYNSSKAAYDTIDVNSAIYDDDTENAYAGAEYDLCAGQYKFVVTTKEDYDEGLDYSLKTSFVSANESFPESEYGTNNSLEAANLIQPNITYNCQFSQTDKIDYYYFNIPVKGSVNLKITGDDVLDYVNVYLHTKSGASKMILNREYTDKTNASRKVKCNYTTTLAEGDYYIRVKTKDTTGNYTLCLTYTQPAVEQPAAQTDTTTTTKKKKVSVSAFTTGKHKVYVTINTPGKVRLKYKGRTYKPKKKTKYRATFYVKKKLKKKKTIKVTVTPKSANYKKTTKTFKI